MQPTKIQDIESHPHFEMVKMESGAFWMGDDNSAYDNEKPAHKVQVPDFYIGKYPITQAIWEMVMENNPSHFKGKNHPVENVSWDMVVEKFIPKLNELSGKNYRLPSEVEWEYAARGGKYQSPYQYSGSNHLKEVGWYDRNSHSSSKPVGTKMPNVLGLYDMSGNVWEWCSDHWNDNYDGAPSDGSSWLDQSKNNRRRVLRGGSWLLNDISCRVSTRDWYIHLNWDNIVGFRLSRY